MKSINFLIVICSFLVLSSCADDAIQTMYVSDQTQDCVGVMPQKCLQVKFSESEDWSNFHDAIEGFDYEQGYLYRLKVEKIQVENPPADASSIRYRLVELLDKTKAPTRLDQGQWLVTKLKDHTVFNRSPFLEIDLKTLKITGNTACNRFFGNLKIKEDSVSIFDFSMTEMTCKTADIERVFVEALKEIKVYTIDDNILSLKDASNNIVMQCKLLKDTNEI